MKPSDIVYRCNIVTLSEEECSYEQRTMIDHSASEISTEEAAILVEAVRKELERDGYHFFVGTSYRHALVWNHGEVIELTPPHDILERTINTYLPNESQLLEMQRRSFDLLNQHPINLARAEKGLHKANSLWFWGAGTKPALSSFEEKTGKKGAMISAVDLLKGIAVGAGMVNITVDGANGGLHTNYEGKAAAAVEAVTTMGNDFVYVHVEAPDEMGHQGSIERKIEAIENLDRRVIGPIKEAMDKSGEEYRILVMPDHPTPVRIRTHTSEPVPYLIYDNTRTLGNYKAYSEEEAKKSGNIERYGYRLMNHFLK